jgi:hypothetical protein
MAHEQHRPIHTLRKNSAGHARGGIAEGIVGLIVMIVHRLHCG